MSEVFASSSLLQTMARGKISSYCPGISSKVDADWFHDICDSSLPFANLLLQEIKKHHVSNVEEKSHK